MGVDVTAMCCIGIYTEEPKDFLASCGLFDDSDDETVEEDGWEEYKGELSVQAVSYYSDQGYYVGFMFSGFGVLEAAKHIEESGKRFKELTGHDAEVDVFCQWH